MKTEVRFITPEEWPVCLELRRRVFVEEQGFPEDAELDEYDTLAEHRHVLLLADGAAVGTARIRPLSAECAKYQRICLEKSARGLGLGAVLMRGVDQLAAQEGYTSAVVEAQQYAQGFYERCGFTADTGEVFYECGKPHVKMSKKIISEAKA